MNIIAHPMPKGRYISLSLKNKTLLVARASDDLTENLSCESDEMFIAYLEVTSDGAAVFSSADLKEHNYHQGFSDGLNLAADRLQDLIDENGIS